MIGIYKITNKINGKIYIGQSINIERRFLEHKYKKDLAIDQAIQKYGQSNFDFEILEECSKDELDTKEQYWINYYNTYLGKGYNCVEGGQANRGESNGRHMVSKKDVEYIRKCYNEHAQRREVYKKFSNKITFDAFAKIWDGSTWNDVMPEVYTKENLEYYKSHATDGEKSQFSILTDNEVLECRKRYVKETAKQIYEDYKNRIKFQTLQQILWGRTYKHLPIYKKKEKKWINIEACNDYPL